jgi:hypothetical protein
VTLNADAWEVNVDASRAEIASLRNIRNADWDSRQPIEAGRSAGESAFWAYEDGQVWLLIGHDEETWDEFVDEIVSQAEQAC